MAPNEPDGIGPAPGMLVSTGWLNAHLGDRFIRVVDLRWREDGSGRDRYDAGHIPGAVFVDWASDLTEPHAPVAFTLASRERFADLMQRCGIGDETTVVAYADAFGSGPARLWLAARLHGHDSVVVLDGGLDRWLAEGRSLSRETMAPPWRSWSRRFGDPLVCGRDEVERAAGRPDVVVLDSRPPEQFRGEAVWFETGAIAADPDGLARTPRGELRAGRIPWARNLPSLDLYRPDRRMKSREELIDLFAANGIGRGTRVITYCGVGISASAMVFALRLAGVDDVALYDASWEEWGRDPSLPVARDER